MKSIIIIGMLLMSSLTWAQQMGVGLSLGNPTGLNAKYWLENDHAIDGGLGFSIGKHSDVSLHSDYLLQNSGAFIFNDVHPLDLYYGLGGRMEFADDIEIGVRVPVGIAHRLESGKADTFAEIAPIFDFITNTGVEIHLLIGARYYL